VVVVVVVEEEVYKEKALLKEGPLPYSACYNVKDSKNLQECEMILRYCMLQEFGEV
jgi:hypothetical protein